ncbi:hypothetical protein CHISP_2438 [Chitinispirillum alkaliphilum]|nr:hypothetical protein CHISP_2438 [Chitinispirillum alkaliphilum]
MSLGGFFAKYYDSGYHLSKGFGDRSPPPSVHSIRKLVADINSFHTLPGEKTSDVFTNAARVNRARGDEAWTIPIGQCPQEGGVLAALPTRHRAF